jgi:hypothetical protein
MFIVLNLNLVAGTGRDFCNTTLQLLLYLLEEVFLRDKGILTNEEQRLLKDVPKDVRGVRKAFHIEPKITTYAACPACSSIYPPTSTNPPHYPKTCTYKRYPVSDACGIRLTKLDGAYKGESVYVPRKPYVVQDFSSFLGRFYSRALIEEAIERTKGTFERHRSKLRDISHGSVVGELQEHKEDGETFSRPFLREDVDELRTVWSLSYDGFNPLLNKAAGKTASLGCFSLVCLSLPPSLRNLHENMCLWSLPTKVDQDKINRYLKPMVDDFLNSYENGRWITRTHQREEGRRSREALVILVCDLLGARKLTGAAGHSATKFCQLCWLPKGDINNTDHKNWRRMTLAEHKAAAEAWRDAPDKETRTTLYRENGVRWSEMLRLPYFDPTRSVAIDGMHNLFLGVVMHHFRVIIGMDIPDPDPDEDPDLVKQERPPSNAEMMKGRTIMLMTPNNSKLHGLRLPVLRALCDEFIGHIQYTNKRPRKKDYIAQLLVCFQHVYNFFPKNLTINSPREYRLKTNVALSTCLGRSN